jgi:hypothetical protein
MYCDNLTKHINVLDGQNTHPVIACAGDTYSHDRLQTTQKSLLIIRIDYASNASGYQKLSSLFYPLLCDSPLEIFLQFFRSSKTACR